ncbi:hypothetical protein KAU39_02075 [bacterium]|nr:hypothetical protein [bacterium]
MSEEDKILKVYDVIYPGEEKILPAIYEKDKQFFDMAVKLLKLFSLSKEIIKPENISKEVRDAFFGLHTQSFRLFRSIVILCKSGLASEAFIQLRSLLEVISYLLYIAEKDHQGRLEYYQHSRSLSEKVALDKYLYWFPNKRSNLNKKIEQIEEKEKEAIQYFKRKHGKNIKLKEIKKKCLRARQAAETLKNNKLFFNDIYMFIYPRSSAISHGEKIGEYLSPSDNLTEVRGRLMGGHRRVCLIYSCSLFFSGIQRINELFQIGKDNIINEMGKELKELIKNNNKQVIKS